MATDLLRSAVLAGEPLPCNWVIDSHAHLGEWFNFYLPDSSLEAYVAQMDRVGIHLSCVTATYGIGPDMHRGNALVADAVKRYPRRFVAYCTINPHHPEQSLEELNGWQMPLVKFHPATHRYPMDGPGYEPALRFAEAHSAPLLIHIWHNDPGCEPERLGRLAEKYPGIPFIAGHSGATDAGIRECVALAKEFPNIYLDPTSSRVYLHSVETLVAGPGPKQVLLGTDMGFFDARPQVGRIVFADLSDEIRRQLLGETMRHLLLNAKLLPDDMRRYLEGEQG